MKLVTQETPHGCGVACLAMILGITYSSAHSLLGRNVEEEYYDNSEIPFIGVIALEMVAVFWRNGISSTSMFTDRETWKGTWLHTHFDRLAMLKLDDLNRHIGEGGTAILGVPSLNVRDGLHWIMVSNGMVLDPTCYEKKYRSIDGVAVGEAVLIWRRP